MYQIHLNSWATVENNWGPVHTQGFTQQKGGFKQDIDISQPTPPGIDIDQSLTSIASQLISYLSNTVDSAKDILYVDPAACL